MTAMTAMTAIPAIPQRGGRHVSAPPDIDRSRLIALGTRGAAPRKPGKQVAERP